MMKTTTFAGLAIATTLALSTSSAADVTIQLESFRMGRLDFAERISPGALVGTLTAISVNATISEARQRTQAQDLCVYLDAPPLSVHGVLQVGGGTPLINGWNPPITEDGHPMWGSGTSGIEGTIVFGLVQLAEPILMTNSPLAVFVGNGYGAPWSIATWNGSITLHGVDYAGPIGSTDLDGDGVADDLDNCPSIANADQRDCDVNGVGDVCESDASVDSNGDGWLDGCQIARGDLNLSRNIDGDDLVVVLSNWGAQRPTVPDPSGDGQYDGDDLVIVLSNWGVAY